MPPRKTYVKPSFPDHITVNDAEGKVMPQSLEMESAVLGALMLDEGKESTVLSLLDPLVFYNTAHEWIARAILILRDNGDMIDILTVTEQLRYMGKLDECGGPYYITILTNRISSTAHTTFHYRIIQQYYMRRRIIELCAILRIKAYDDTVDVFDLLEEAETELAKANLGKNERLSQSNSQIADEMLERISATTVNVKHKIYKTRWKNFDSRVTTTADKIILVAGGAKMGKTKFVAMWVDDLLELHKDVAVDWITLEDSAPDQVAHYLASKVRVKTKDIKAKDFSPGLMPYITEHFNRWKTFDIEFIDQSITISKIGLHFKNFCMRRPDKFNILIIDNILSLDDRKNYLNNINQFYDDVMNRILDIRRDTGGLIIVVHHFRDAQQDKENLRDGYRPRLTDIKGTEAFRRVPNNVLMINTPGKYKDLLGEYKGDRKTCLKKLFLVDIGASRDDDNIGENEGVVRFLASLDFNIFREVDYYDPQKGMKGAIEDFNDEEQPF